MLDEGVAVGHRGLGRGLGLEYAVSGGYSSLTESGSCELVSMPYLFSAFLFSLMMIIAAVGDALTYRISNHLNLFIAGMFFPAAFACSMSLPILIDHLVVGIVMLLLGIVLFRLRLLGGGDAKLLAAASLWLGSVALLPFLMWMALSGGVLGVVIALSRLSLMRTDQTPPRKDVPYGIALAIGAIAALPQSTWMMHG